MKLDAFAFAHQKMGVFCGSVCPLLTQLLLSTSKLVVLDGINMLTG